MSDIMPGTLVQMRTLRRFSHYNAGEVIAVSLEAGRELEAKRLALPLAIMVPSRPGDTPADVGPTRQPGSVVRK
jgi:hypothetical protein